jgi:hypothetical protein
MRILRQRTSIIFEFVMIWSTEQGRQPPGGYVRICCKTVAAVIFALRRKKADEHKCLLPSILQRRHRVILSDLAPFIEYDSHPINFSKILFWLKNLHLFGLDLKKLVFIVTKWCQCVTMSIVLPLAFEKGFMSLCHSFCFSQFCSPLVGFFRLVPSFVKCDYLRLLLIP